MAENKEDQQNQEERGLTAAQIQLRGQLRLLADRVSGSFYDQRNHIFGRVATIIDASTADLAQRKSMKDLLSDVVYNPHYWDGTREEFVAIAKANGFELWEEPKGNMIVQAQEPANPYVKL